MDAVNVEATRDLLVAARAAGVRYFGFASSVVVYGSPSRREVTEETPQIDLGKPMIRQYLANPLMLDYARTKIQAEKALTADAVGVTIDIYRPTVAVNMDELLQVGDWSTGRKARSAHRTTQYITTIDVAAAICHLMKRGLSAPARGFTEVYNLADDTAGTYSQLLDKAFGATKDPRFQTKVRLPALADRVKDFLQYGNLKTRTSLGRLRVSNAKLRNTGFVFPLGMKRALDQVLTEEVRRARPIGAGD
jgi:nucleoside-diphosphate-sugar epimerase